MRSSTVRVLQGFTKPRPTSNPYLTLLTRNLPNDIESSYFTWGRALFGSYDLLHLQWIEHFVASQIGIKGRAKRILLRLLAARIGFRKIPVVCTIHNISSHDPVPARDIRNYTRFERLVSGYIRLNPYTKLPSNKMVRTIPHGHYRDWYPSVVRADHARTTGLFFGMVRPYKNIEDLIHAANGLDEDYLIKIVGAPKNQQYAESITKLALNSERIQMKLEHVNDAALVQEIANSEFVVLPYREMHNSGAALLALSLNTPIVVLDNEVNRDLQKEFGKNFVFLFKNILDRKQLSDAIRWARSNVPVLKAVNMDSREWPNIGCMHADFYVSILALQVSGRKRGLNPPVSNNNREK